MTNQKIRTIQEWNENFYEKALREWEKVISGMILESEEKKVYIPGECSVCGGGTHFLLDDRYSASGYLNFRERLVCSTCKLNNRQRALFSLLKDMNAFDSHVYIMEQVTRFYAAMKTKCFYLTGSEFLGDKVPLGCISEQGIRNEDAMNLSFSNESFDYIISQDVYEHIPDIKTALKEAWRVLKSSGKLIVSIPFHWKDAVSTRRAIIKDGGIVHLLAPIYHGNPIAPQKGSLVFWDYGWDFLGFMREAGFKDAYIVKYYSPQFGNVGVIFYIIAEK